MKIIDFLNCKIDVSKGVFIPRIETEFWVKKAINDAKKSKVKSQKLKILDIFAGSGCIGIAILKNIKNSQVDFVDIDEKAIAQIKVNLKLNKISPKRYKVLKSNLFKKLAPYRNEVSGAGYDVIFANPPYVAKERIKEVDEEVLRTEPWISFFAGEGGLIYIKKFLREVKNYLKNEGLIYFEFDPKQKKEIEKILKKEGYSDFQFKKDQFKKYRWLRIKYVKR